MNKPKKGSGPYIVRGLAYSTTSLLVLISGYLMGNVIYQPLTFLLMIPIGLFTIFFVTYAVCYDYDYAEQGITHEYAQVAHREAIRYTSILVVAFVVIALLAYVISGGPLPNAPFFAYVLLNCFLYLSYSRYLYLKCRLAGNPQIRHWLFWPVILCVAISLYYARYFSLLGESLKPHFPVLILLIFFLVAEIIKARQKLFLTASLLGISVLIVLTILHGLFGVHLPEILATYVPAMLFSIIMSVYLAVFESWRMTAFIADKESEAKDEITAKDDKLKEKVRGNNESSNDNPFNNSPLTQRYYSATLLAHTIAIWFIPLAYIFSDYSVIFIGGFTLHAIASFGFWLLRGEGPESLSKKDWSLPKTVFGVAFLILMVVGVRSKTDLPLSTNLIASKLKILWVPMAFASGAFGTMVYREFTSLDHAQFMARLFRFFSNKANVIRLVAISTFVACSIIIFIDDFPTVLPFINKAQQAYVSYYIIFICCCLVEFLNITNLYRFRAVVSALLGVVYTLRVPPSLLIGLTIFLPGFASGHPRSALMAALPFMLVAMGGFALNDYFDVEKDIINKSYRAVPSGKMNRSQLLFVSTLLLTFSLLAEFLVMKTNREAVIYLTAFVGVMAYNLVVRYLGYTKAFYTAACSSLPLIYDIFIYKYSYAYLLATGAFILFVSGRELLMDVRDMPGDRSVGMTTLPMLIGPMRTGNLAFLLKGISLALLIPLLSFSLIPPAIAFGIWMVMIGSLLVMYRLWWLRSGRYQSHIIRSLWATMFFGIIIVAGSSV